MQLKFKVADAKIVLVNNNEDRPITRSKLNQKLASFKNIHFRTAKVWSVIQSKERRSYRLWTVSWKAVIKKDFFILVDRQYCEPQHNVLIKGAHKHMPHPVWSIVTWLTLGHVTVD